MSTIRVLEFVLLGAAIGNFIVTPTIVIVYYLVSEWRR